MIAKELRHRHVLSEPRAAARLQVSHRMTFVKPTAFLGVPRVYEKIMETLLAIGKTIPAPVKAVSDYATYSTGVHVYTDLY